MTTKFTKTFLAKSLIGVLIFSVITIGGFDTIAQSLTSTQYNTQKSQIDTETESIKKQISELGGSLEDVSKKKNTLQEEVRQAEEDIKKINDLIVQTEELITKIDTEIKQNEKDIADLLEEMKVLLLEIQKNQQISPIENLVSSRNFGEAISKLYALSTTQNSANDLKIQIEDKIKELELNLEKQKQTKIDLESSKILLEGKKSYLDSLITNYKGKEDEYAKQIGVLKEQQKINDEQAQKLQSEWEAEKKRLAEEAKKTNTGGGNTGGGSGGGSGGGNYGGSTGCFFENSTDPGVPAGFFQRPIASGYVVYQNFGCPSNWGNLHDALDIAIGAGTPIGSTAGGVVAAKGSVGYGNWVMIKHTLPNGRRIYSLYAHMISQAPVSVGQTVNKGQTIGYVGCTGICYGNHVHFMLYDETYETKGLGTGIGYGGSSKVYNPARWISF